MDDNSKTNKFDWGEAVKISDSAPKQYHPFELGSVCGMIEIDSQEVAIAYDCVGSSWLYTVEFSDGNDMQIPELFLEKYEENPQNNA